MTLHARSRCRRALELATLIVFLGSIDGSAAFAAETVRVSVDDNGLEGNATSRTPELNADGRFVAFISEAGNLVAGDTNDSFDVFVHDRLTHTVERVSISSGGVEGNNHSGTSVVASCVRAEISSQGRWVVFQSAADNLVVGDTNDTTDVFLHDRQTGQTERVSLDAGGAEIAGPFASASPAISGDGRFVAFVTSFPAVPGDVNESWDVFVRDRVAGTTERVSVGSGGIEANEDSHCPSLSNDGRFVAFHSTATNLVPGDANGTVDVFVHDRLGDTTQRVSVSSAGLEGEAGSANPRISGNGRLVAFQSEADNLVAGDGNQTADVFVRDLQTGVTTRASTAVDGTEGSGIATLDLDDTGRYVVFSSLSADLVPDDTNNAPDVFAKDLLTGMIRRVTVAHDGGAMEPSLGGLYGVISGNGRVVAFSSEASNLVAGDTNEVDDVFVRELPTFPYEYAAKVVCGTQSNPAGLSLAPGVYATTVNVHSPTGGVEFFKKLALSHPPREQRPGEIFPIAQHVLQYDQAIAVDCDDLLREVFGGVFPDSYVEGFLVIQSTGSLDVTAVYSTAALDARGRAGNHSSIDVEPVAERRKSPQLSVTKSGRYFCNAVPIERECTLVAALYTVVVRNDGAVPAEEVVLTDVVSRSDGLPVVFVLPAPHEEPAGAVFAVTGPRSIQVEIAELAPGEEAQVRFWALAVISPGYQPDVLINRAEVTAENVEGTATAVTQQGFD